MRKGFQFFSSGPDTSGRRGSRVASGSDATSGVYIDVENLRESAHQVIMALMEHWPEVAPPPRRISLYVRADQVELWRLWTTSHFPALVVEVKGVQHFTATLSKNSADIALAADAISDLLMDRVKHVTVVSDDSDFIALYAKVREETTRSQPGSAKVPFLWVVTDRSDTLSPMVKQYFPNELLHSVHCDDGQQDAGMPTVRAPARAPARRITANGGQQTTWEEMARAIIGGLPLGSFGSTDCQKIIRERWPDHPLASASGPNFGMEFLKNIWPLIEGKGGNVANPGRKPRRYEMTEAAKQTVL